MARFETEGLDDLAFQLARMGESTGKLAHKILFAGAEEVKKAWKRAATEKGLHLTGQMINSIGYANEPKKGSDVLSIDIYPQGKSTYSKKKGKTYIRKKSVRNAEIAFINHYGKSGNNGTHFVDYADDLSGPMVEEAVTEVFDRWLEENGMI